MTEYTFLTDRLFNWHLGLCSAVLVIC